jgi:hypothetical protein
MADRAAGDKEGATRLIDELARRMPEEPALKWVVLESRIKDRGDAASALAELRGITPAADDRRAVFRQALLTADAYKALGFVDSARATLTELGKKFPDSPTVAAAMAALEGK